MTPAILRAQSEQLLEAARECAGKGLTQTAVVFFGMARECEQVAGKMEKKDEV